MGVLVVDSKGIIRLTNPKLRSIFGHTKDELINQALSVLVPDSIRSAHEDHRKKFVKNPHPRGMGVGLDLYGQKKNGDRVPLEISLNPFQLDGENLVAAFVVDISDRKRLESEILHNTQNLEKIVIERTQELEHLNLGLQTQIYERKNAEKELRKSQKKLEAMLDKERELNALKSRFVSMASHEFRTPLSTILSSISLVDRYSDQADIEKRNKHIQKIRNSVKHLTDILEDFLSLGRLEEGKVDPVIENVNVTSLAHGVVNDLSVMLDPSQRMNFDCNKDLVIRTDKKLLRQILVNLLSNAIKYSDKGEINLRIREKKDQLKIEVQDEGIGIPIEDQKNMFTRFFRAGNATNIEGTGLGLNIVSKHVDLLGGSITFKSEEGVGSVFNVMLNKKG